VTSNAAVGRIDSDDDELDRVVSEEFKEKWGADWRKKIDGVGAINPYNKPLTQPLPSSEQHQT